MQFVVTALDGDDAGAYNRRKDNRDKHLVHLRTLKMTGNFIFGGAILGEDKEPIGSMVIYDYPHRAALEEALKQEPYVINKVWQNIQIDMFRVAPL